MNILEFLPSKQKETLDLIDYACNSTGLLSSLIQLQSQLRRYKLVDSTDEINSHPITRFFLQKLMSMTTFDDISTAEYIKLDADLHSFGEYLQSCLSYEKGIIFINKETTSKE